MRSSFKNKQLQSDDVEKIIIELSTKIVVLKIQQFNTDVDTDELLRIDYANILGEVLTFPLIFNRIGNLRAEAAEILAISKVDFDIFEAQLVAEYQKKLQAKTEKRITNKDIDSSIYTDARWGIKKKELILKEKNYNIIDALYWGAKSKDTKLDKISEKIKPEEFEKELIEGVINGVMIKCSTKVMQ